MPTLFDTKYPNNSRVISGVATIYRDDVILLCDTSSAPVTINLFDIPNGFWSTQWKLYIIDNNNNASVNNITINAGVGQLVNNQANLILNSNGASAVIEIVSNTSFIANLTNVGGGGGSVNSVTGLDTDNTDPTNPIVQIAVDGVTITGLGTPSSPLVAVGGGSGYNTVENEGVALTQRSTINFIGRYVNATDNGAKTEVTINPIIEDITNGDLINAIATNTLLKGLFYRVIDTNGILNVVLLAIETNRIQLNGAAELLTADYQSVGDYTGLNSFPFAGFPTISQIGIWNTLLTPTYGSVVIWNNNHYVNITALNGLLSPNLDAVNWFLLNRQEDYGYIKRVYTIDYNINANRPERIWDDYGNLIEYKVTKGQISFFNFPFGNELVRDNTIIGDGVNIQNMMNMPFLTCSNNYLNGSTCIFLLKKELGSGVVDFNQNINNSGTINLTGFLPSGGISCNTNVINNGTVEINNDNLLFTSDIIFETNRVDNGNISIGLTGILQGLRISIVDNIIQTNDDRLRFDNIDASIFNVNIKKNSLSNGVNFTLDLENTQFIENNLSLSGIYVWTTPLISNNTQGGIGSILSKEKSTFSKILDFSDPLVYDIGLQTLDLGVETYIGRYLLTNVGVGTVVNMTNGQTVFPFSIEPQNNGETLTVNFTILPTVLASSLSNTLVNNVGILNNLNFTCYSNDGYRDSLTFTRKNNNSPMGLQINNWLLSTQKAG
jgi:hypothetical protein